jgi:hypothetical protein
MHSEGLYENWRRDIPNKRPFFLIRQAFAGQQRNAATLWSSDITCTWSSYKNQVPQGINSCASGIPYWTSDIGGYHFHWMSPTGNYQSTGSFSPAGSNLALSAPFFAFTAKVNVQCSLTTGCPYEGYFAKI